MVISDGIASSDGDPSISLALIPQPSHKVKWIRWTTGDAAASNMIPVVTQNENGPCSLLALVNVLFLRGQAHLEPGLKTISSEQLLGVLRDCIIRMTPQRLPAHQADYERNVEDAVASLPKLLTGIDVNLRFTGADQFEHTPDFLVFDLLNIPLYHDWLVEPERGPVADAVGQYSYNQLMDFIIEAESGGDHDKLVAAGLAQNFLETTATQLTYRGLRELSSSLEDGALCVFFRSGHFSTLLKHDVSREYSKVVALFETRYPLQDVYGEAVNELFCLVTDKGFLNESRIVWESLNSLDGDSRFVDAEFRWVPPKPVPVPAAPPIPADASPREQSDRDLMAALSLEEQEKRAMDAAVLREQRQGTPLGGASASILQQRHSPDSATTTSHCSSGGKKDEAPPQLVSRHLNFAFGDPFWRSSVQPVDAMLKDILRFLIWYRDLPDLVHKDIVKAGIVEKFRILFVFRMCAAEAEGVQSKGETEAVARQNPNYGLSNQQRITYNMFRALNLMKQVAHSTGTESDGMFLITIDMLNEWHRALWKNVRVANFVRPGVPRGPSPGVSFTWQPGNGTSHKHYYAASETVQDCFWRFTDAFCIIAKTIHSLTAEYTVDRIGETIKWAAWSLLYLLSLHPYKDGNGRTARFLANYVLSSVFPFEIPVYNVFSKTTRDDYLEALIRGRNCPCDFPKPDGRKECWTFDEAMRYGDPSLIATMILDSCWYACRKFRRNVEKKIPDILIKFPLDWSPSSPGVVLERPTFSQHADIERPSSAPAAVVQISNGEESELANDCIDMNKSEDCSAKSGYSGDGRV